MDSCLYCDSLLVRFDAHPTWKLCPKCDREHFAAFVPPAVSARIDMRGAPSRPGPPK